MPCTFCSIAAGGLPAALVLDEPEVLAFLDVRPVFPGHVLVVPRVHHETLPDLPSPLLPVVFEAAQRIAAAVLPALGADGTFVAINNTVSQSVPHLHVHVVPRRRKDGLRGFFWPRQKYDSDEAMHDVAARIRDAIERSGAWGDRYPPEHDDAATAGARAPGSVPHDGARPRRRRPRG